MRKIIFRRVLWVFLIATGPALAWATYFLCTRPLPKAVTIALQIPEGAEVRPASTVTPGTFKIEVSLEEFLSRAKTSIFPALVSWGRADDLRTLSVEYWLPRGDSTFFHAVFSRHISWPIGVKSSAYTMERMGQGIVVKPTHGDGWTILSIFGLLVYIYIIVQEVVKHFDRRHRAQTTAT